MGLVGHAPLDIVVLELHPALQHGGGRPLELLDALVVVIHEDPRDLAVPRLDQQSDQLIGALLIVDDDPGVAEIFIVVVVKNDGDVPAVNLAVAVQIGVEHAGLDAVHNKALKILMDHCLQATPLIGKLVVGKKDPEVHLPGGQHAFDPLQQFGVCVGILALQDQTDLQGRRSGSQLPGEGHFFVDVRPAPLYFLDHTLLGQLVQRGAHGLAAHIQPPAQSVFRGELQVPGKLHLINVGREPLIDLLRFFARSRQTNPLLNRRSWGAFPRPSRSSPAAGRACPA